MITTLNKVISLFLVGALTLVGCVSTIWWQIGRFAISTDLTELVSAFGEGFWAIVGGIAFLSLALFFGAVTEALTDITYRKLLMSAEGKRWLSALLGQAASFDALNRWKEQFEECVAIDERFSGLPPEMHHGLAAGLFHERATGENFSWMESHYASFILITNLGFLATAALLTLLGLGFAGSTSILAVTRGTAILGSLIWLFGSLGLRRFFFTYIFAFRQVTVAYLVGMGTGQLAALRKEAKDGEASHRSSKPLTKIEQVGGAA